MMLRILCLLSFLAFSHAGDLPFFNSRIVNGKDAKEGEIPYQVSIQRKNSNFHFCGGSILNDKYVITAAHCVEHEYLKNIKVVAATINLNQNNSKSEHNVIKIIVHEGYHASQTSIVNDIALLKVQTPFIKSVTVRPIPLPPRGHVVKANDVAVVSGWGRLWKGGPTTTKLQRVNILIVGQDNCWNIYARKGLNIYPTHVCAHDSSANKGICFGDSGGPLTVDGKLVGLVSWSIDCANTAYPGVYTRVVSYLDWIAANAI
ncbi:PREDICTED: trypsin-1-like [Wasmannia auropunctata]|uniref:trypsin-1-like n=1 Tax=Wasmannia auropunctata TaxID=64793 RepID=UPI0005EF7C52|nr:PREDICTED: trypsin-1-like [Wasmannia auropunctata]